MATRRWLGHAVDVAEVKTLTVGGTVEADDVFNMTINNKTLSVVAGATNTETVANTIAAAWNASTIPEFAEITAADSGSDIVLTHDTAGIPFTVSRETTEDGGGAADSQTFGLANTTAATGKWHFDDADNWSGNAVPVDGDDIVFDTGAVDCRYGLDQSAVTPASITIEQGYTGHIGLPETNILNTSSTYREYRTQYLTLCDSGDATNTAVSIGEGEGAGSGRIKLDLSDGQATINIRNSGQRAETAFPAILLKGTHASNEMNVQRGDVAFAIMDGESGHLATLRVGYIENQAGDSKVRLGSGVDIANAAITIDGGTVEIDSATGSGTIVVHAGELSILSGAHASVIIDGGTVFYRSNGTLSASEVGSGGILDFRRDNRPRTVSAIELHDRGTLLDPLRTATLSSGVDLVRCSIDDVTLDLGTNMTLTPSDI